MGSGPASRKASNLHTKRRVPERAECRRSRHGDNGTYPDIKCRRRVKLPNWKNRSPYPRTMQVRRIYLLSNGILT